MKSTSEMEDDGRLNSTSAAGERHGEMGEMGGARMTSRPRKLYMSSSVTHAELDDEVVLLDTESGTYFSIDGVGTLIWEMLRHGATEERIVRRILREYDVAPDIAQADVAEFLGMLAERGLVREEDE